MNNRILWISLLSSIVLAGCAAVPPGAESEKDPYQSYNRTMYSINDTVDHAIVKPVAKGYVAVTPDIVRTGVTNFFNNIGDLSTAINDVLQGKFHQGAQDGGRFLVNTTIGLLGLIDMATPAGLDRHREDFGQTMAVWGWKDSAYLVLPLMGPSTLRDTVGLAGDYPWSLYRNINTTYTKKDEIFVGAAINSRANLLAASNVLQEAAFDPYTFVRDAYLQHRRSQIYDGHPPMPKDDE